MDEVYKRLEQKMIDAFLKVYGTSQKYGLDMRKAAYIVAVSRVAEAMKLRGWV
ncbi:MAG: hypothetical protein J7K04_03740 [Spirochaetales bacterium]|nr:hypothetical protein [Spirochaetales bacterium]